MHFLVRECKKAETYIYRYIQDTNPKAPGGHNDRLWVIAKTIKMTEYLPIGKNDKAIELMMETGNDNPLSLQQQITHLEEVQRLPQKKYFR